MTNPETLAITGLRELIAAETAKRKAHETPPTDHSENWERESYINSQFARLRESEALKPTLQITADLNGHKTNHINLYWHQLSAIQDAVLNTADPHAYDGIPVHDEVSVQSMDYVYDGKSEFSSHYRVTFHDLVILLYPIGTDESNDEYGGNMRLYSIRIDEADGNCTDLSLSEPADQHLIERILWEAIPAEHCQHEYDCCGRAYRNSPDFFYRACTANVGKWRTLTHIGISYTVNV